MYSFLLNRTTSVGTCSTVARFGAIAGLLIEILGDYWKPAPNFVMGIIAIIAGCLGVFLPETTGLGLPETMEQAISLSSKPSPGLLSCNIPKSIKELSIRDMLEKMQKLKKTENDKSDTKVTQSV